MSQLVVEVSRKYADMVVSLLFKYENDIPNDSDNFTEVSTSRDTLIVEFFGKHFGQSLVWTDLYDLVRTFPDDEYSIYIGFNSIKLEFGSLPVCHVRYVDNRCEGDGTPDFNDEDCFFDVGGDRHDTVECYLSVKEFLMTCRGNGVDNLFKGGVYDVSCD